MTRRDLKEIHVLSLGVGVQSIRLYLGFLGGEFSPQIDCAIFADTKREPRHVYDNLEWLQSLNGPQILVRSNGDLMDDLLRFDNGDGRFATIPAFTAGGGRVGRQCSKEYKTDVIERTIRRELLGLVPGQRVPKGVIVHQYIGISLDERGRSFNIERRFRRKLDPDDIEFGEDAPYRWGVPHFPLLDNLITRAECEDWILKHTGRQIRRSSCTFCPNHDDREWHRMKLEDPESFNEAVVFDRTMRESSRMISRGLHDPMYLHRSCIPLSEVVFDTRPKAKDLQMHIGFYNECEGVCGV